MLSAYASETKTASQVGSPTQVYSKTANGQLASASEIFQTPQVCINTQTRTASQPIVLYNPALPVKPQRRASRRADDLRPDHARIRPVHPGRPDLWAVQAGAGHRLADHPAGSDGQRDPAGGARPSTLNYDFDHMNVKSITSFIHDASYSSNAGGEDRTQQQWLVGGPAAGQRIGHPRLPAVRAAAQLSWPVHGLQQAERGGAGASVLLAVRPAAVHLGGRPLLLEPGHPPALLLCRQGPRRLGAGALRRQLRTALRHPECLRLRHLSRSATSTTTNWPVFAEANYWFTDKLKATAGVRLVDRIGFSLRAGSTMAPSTAAIRTRPTRWSAVRPSTADDAQGRAGIRLHPQRPGLCHGGQGLPRRRHQLARRPVDLPGGPRPVRHHRQRRAQGLRARQRLEL